MPQKFGRRGIIWTAILISIFVFFVAISLVGSLITAVLRLANVHWATPLTRIAEIIAVAAIIFASLIIIVDMGRPERFLNLLVYGRLQSPIMWDVIVIGTYFFISLLLLYFPLLPDLKILLSKKEQSPLWLQKIYHFLGSFWKGTKQQFKISEKAINILCITIIPVAFCIHTVTHGCLLLPIALVGIVPISAPILFLVPSLLGLVE